MSSRLHAAVAGPIAGLATPVTVNEFAGEADSMYVLLGCAVSLCVTFGTSVAVKARRGSFRAFATAAGPLALFPARLRTGLAAAAVAAEGTVLAGLLAGQFAPWWPTVTTAAFAGAALLLAAFTVVIELSLRRGERAPCRCFGTGRAVLGHGHAVRNLLLFAVAVVGGLTSAMADRADVEPAGAAVAMLAGLAAGVIAVRFDDLIHVLGGSAQLSARPMSSPRPGPDHR